MTRVAHERYIAAYMYETSVEMDFCQKMTGRQCELIMITGKHEIKYPCTFSEKNISIFVPRMMSDVMKVIVLVEIEF